jgi:hypothetical protein
MGGRSDFFIRFDREYASGSRRRRKPMAAK